MKESGHKLDHELIPDEGEIQMFGHPKGLFYLFFAELWERFSFYGMRALLVLYLINDLFENLANGTEVAYEIYAAYGSLVYFTPALGGMIADRLIGHKNSIVLGAILMTLGHFVMAFEDEYIFYIALGLLIMGNGFFKPNISTMVGGLYKQGDVRRDAGFTIFYLGINVGAFIAPLICGWLGTSYGWHYGFGAAGIGMLAGLAVFWYGAGNNIYGDQGHQPKEWKDKTIAGMNIRVPVWILSFAAVPVFAYLVQNNSTKILASVFEDMGMLQFLLFTLLLLVILYIVFISIFKLSRQEVSRLVVVCVLTLFITVFWSFFEQSGSALTNFAEQNVNLVGLNASQTNSINPFWIMILAIPFSLMWKALDKKGLNPNTPVKFALGIAQLGVGFLVFSLAAGSADANGMVPMMFLIIGYLLLTTGELFVSPIGLSKVTELSPAWLTAFMMGVWFLSSSFAHFIAGIISKMTISDNGADGWIQTTAKGITGMNDSALEGASEGMINLANYTNVFAQIGILSLIIAAMALAVSPILKKMMYGVK